MSDRSKKQKNKYSSGAYSSKRQVSGPGIFVTTIRGKEFRCVAEFYNVLDEIADRLYPASRLDELEKTRPKWSTPATAPIVDAEGSDERQEHIEALAQEGAMQEDDPVDVEEEDQSIEAMIAREIAALNPRKVKKPKTRSTNPTNNGKKAKPRFVSVETGTECLCFFAVAWPYDPVEICNGIVSELRETGVIKTKFALRLTPISFSCHALRTDEILLNSKNLLQKTLRAYADAHSTSEITYSIDPSIRSHTDPITRPWLLTELGQAIQEVAAAESLKVKANLSAPDLVMLPVVLKKEFGLGVVEGNGWAGKQGKKWNLDSIGAELNQRRFEGGVAEGEEGATANRSLAARVVMQ